MPYSNSEARRKHNKERYANDSKFRKDISRAGKRWREANKEAFNKCIAAWNKQHPQNLREAVKRYKRTFKGKFNTLCRVAYRRNIKVTITLEQYSKLIAGGLCGYGCGRPLPETGGGLDRISSALGYVQGNCIPCCETCNEIRGHDNISYEEMFEVIRLLKTLRELP